MATASQAHDFMCGDVACKHRFRATIDATTTWPTYCPQCSAPLYPRDKMPRSDEFKPEARELMLMVGATHRSCTDREVRAGLETPTSPPSPSANRAWTVEDLLNDAPAAPPPAKSPSVRVEPPAVIPPWQRPRWLIPAVVVALGTVVAFVLTR